jgi:membrane-associated phospholipid phosphatase
MSLRSILATLRPELQHRRTRAGGRRARSRPQLEPLDGRCLLSADVVLEWNQVLLDTLKADHLLPLYLAREAAIVHAAVYDAVNAIDGSYTPLFADVQAPRGASLEAAAAQAAHDTLVALSPAHRDALDAVLAADLAGIPPGRAKLGIAVGQAVARQILAWRSTDRSDLHVDYEPVNEPGHWQPTPPANAPAVAPQWGQVIPFSIPSGSTFLPPAQPDLTSAEYTAAFEEVKSLGAANSTTRTAEQSDIAQFWYGTAGTYTSVGYWNQIAREVAVERGDSMVQNARLFALLNVAQADSYFAIWDAKYTYDFWRPVTAIRAADTDGNPDTAADPTWTSFKGTPPFPSYVSGHSGHSAAAAAVLAAYFGTDDVAFTLSTDSLPGMTRSYESFSQAVHEVSDSRVFAGIHWRFDVTAGEDLGYQVGNYVATHSLRPVRPHGHDGPAGPAAGGAVTPPSPVLSDTRAEVILVFVPPDAPAHTADTPLPGALQDEAAAPVLQPTLQRRGRPGFRLTSP